MGRVFRAEDSTGRLVALKLLSPDLARSDEALARFKQEGVIASQINHPHCVFVHRVDEDSGTPFIAMELMTGKTLKDLIQHSGPMVHEQAVPLILQCIEGLIVAHSMGMIHRDIKPANCYLDDDGNVKIGDFGLARSLVSDSELTQTGAFLGTPLFASPEQLIGGELDARSDIYSLSATLYYLLAGKAPFESPHAAQVIARIASSDPPAFSMVGVDVPPGLERIVMKGLAREPSKRYSSLLEMKEDLLAIIAPKPNPSSIYRRCFAFFGDYFVISSLISILIFTCFDAVGLSKHPLITQALGALVYFAYFFLQEAIFSTTLGKAAMRVAIVDADTGCKITWWTAFKRSSFFLVIQKSPGLLAGLMAGYVPEWMAAIASIVLYIAALALLFSTWRRSERRQLIHDWFSGTECQTSFGVRPATRNHIVIPDWSLPLKPPSQLAGPLPKELGRFEILGEFDAESCDPSVRWLSALDPRLERNVWIAWTDAANATFDEAQTSKPKSMRMRFIEQGVEGTSHWFAFVAPEGIPILECLAAGVQAPWPAARHLLEGNTQPEDSVTIAQGASLSLADSAAGTSSGMIPLWQTDRIWIDSASRLTMVDLRASLHDRCRQQTHWAFQSQLGALAMLALPPKHRLRSSMISPPKSYSQLAPEGLPPLRALRLLEQIASQRFKPTPVQLASSLRQIDHGVHRVTNKNRMLTSAVSLGLLSPVALLVVVMLAIPSVIAVLHQVERVRNLKSLHSMSIKPELYHEAWDLAPSEAKARWANPDGIDTLDDRIDEETGRLEDAFDHLGVFERFVINSMASAAETSFLDPSQSLVQPDENEPDAEGKARDRTDSAGKKNDRTITRGRVVAGPVTFAEYSNEGELPSRTLVSEILESPDREVDSNDEKNLFPDGEFVAGFLIFGIVWTTVTFGGVTQYFTGSTIVRSDGRRMGIVRSFLRAVLLYLPFAILGIAVVFFNDLGLEWMWMATMFKRALLLLPLVYLASTMIHSTRTPLDWLSGTVAIPR